MRVTMTAGLAVALAMALGAPASASTDTSPVGWFADGRTVPAASSTLIRLSHGVQMTLRTSGLTPGDAVTVWFVIFNDPAACSHGEGPFRCGLGDLLPFGGDPSVHSSVVFGTGHVVGGGGTASFAAALSVGDTSGALFGPGLVDPAGADIHLVVRDHGPMVGSAQIRSFGACNSICTDEQFSVHESG